MLKRESDEKDSTTAVWWNYVLAVLVTGGIFAVEIFFDKGILDGTLIGMLIIKVYDALNLQNAYFFPSQRSPKNGSGDLKNDNRTTS